MIGFGLRLDSPWQTLAGLVLAGGAVVGGVGLWELARARVPGEAFVPDRAGE